MLTINLTLSCVSDDTCLQFTTLEFMAQHFQFQAIFIFSSTQWKTVEISTTTNDAGSNDDSLTQ